jgi:hypothetical protein
MRVRVQRPQHEQPHTRVRPPPQAHTRCAAGAARCCCTRAGAARPSHLKRLTPVPGSLRDFSNTCSAFCHLRPWQHRVRGARQVARAWGHWRAASSQQQHHARVLDRQQLCASQRLAHSLALLAQHEPEVNALLGCLRLLIVKS